MFSSFRNRFGIPGVISVIALVFAMLGGAYAASNDSGSGKATASAKGKVGPRGPRGKPGPAGPAGPAGPQGPAGAAGANGKDGANGLDGEKGATGAKGTSGTNGTNGATGATGPAGATGSTGSTGATGSPWTLGGTLPSGATEVGAWAIGPLKEKEISEALADIQFPLTWSIPLPAELDEAHVRFIKEGEAAPAGCTGGTPAVPKADPGFLCVYTSKEGGTWTAKLLIQKIGEAVLVGEGASKTGALLRGTAAAKGTFARGTFAVTAP